MEQNLGYLKAKKFFNELNAPTYDLLVKFATLGQDYYWKRKILQKKISSTGLVLDLACGTGILSSLLQKKGNIVFGIDLTYEYLKILKTKKPELFCINGIAEYLPFKNNCFDYIVSSYLPKYADLTNLVNECFRVLKNGGKIILHDFIFPNRRIYQELWKIYFKILKKTGKLFFKDWSQVFNELDSLISTTDWYEILPKILLNKGFIRITSESLSMETSAIIYAKKP
ncbi:MAG: class I SAM-dependent methyltransferase [Nitrosopumilus sp.]|nr:class I SAM-dependent methyltransferase [Nitrosopumilus sp.]